MYVLPFWGGRRQPNYLLTWKPSHPLIFSLMKWWPAHPLNHTIRSAIHQNRSVALSVETQDMVQQIVLYLETLQKLCQKMTRADHAATIPTRVDFAIQRNFSAKNELYPFILYLSQNIPKITNGSKKISRIT